MQALSHFKVDRGQRMFGLRWTVDTSSESRDLRGKSLEMLSGVWRGEWELGIWFLDFTFYTWVWSP